MHIALLLLALSFSADGGDDTLRVISVTPAEAQDSTLVQAARSANDARAGHEARVAIDQKKLHHPSSISEKTAAAVSADLPVLTGQRQKRETMEALNALLASSKNLKLLTPPNEAAPAPKN